MADILLIDDDMAVRNVIKRALLQDGHNIREAADGRDALPMMRERAAEGDLLDIANSLGARATLAKPITPVDLRAAIALCTTKT